MPGSFVRRSKSDGDFIMTLREQAAFTADIETARQKALTADVPLEVRDCPAAG